MGGFYVGDPVSDCFRGGILEGRGTGGDGPDLCTQQLHSEDVKGLTFHVLGAHVNDAFEACTGTDGGCGDAVLSCAGLCDDALLAHAFAEESLAQGVVYLMGTGVIEIFSLEVNFCTRAVWSLEVLGESFGVVEWGGSTDVFLQEVVQFFLQTWQTKVSHMSTQMQHNENSTYGERGVVDCLCISLFQFREGSDEGFRYVFTSESPESTSVIGPLHRRFSCNCFHNLAHFSSSHYIIL